MTLHVFNPEHDIALATNLANFTAPHAGRQLRHDLGFLPALWAAEGDMIAVDDPVYAQRALERFALSVKRHLGKRIDTRRQWMAMDKKGGGGQHADSLAPWGWDLALRARLRRCGVEERLLPSDSVISNVRQLSHRRTAAALLSLLQGEGTIGEAFECTTMDEVNALQEKYGHIVLKAPWSSSGRGIRFVSSQFMLHSSQLGVQSERLSVQSEQSVVQNSQQGWLRNVLQHQGSVMVEPYYKKVKDFGMEFVSDGCGKVTFLGLSLFHTANGAYTGNIIATEAAKREILSRYLPLKLLDAVVQKICVELGKMFNDRYCGPFGVDMMVVRYPQSPLETSHVQRNCEPCTMNYALSLHPCVEINLRRTMGHAALALSPTDDDIRRVMRIDYANNVYKLRICRI